MGGVELDPTVFRFLGLAFVSHFFLNVLRPIDQSMFSLWMRLDPKFE